MSKDQVISNPPMVRIPAEWEPHACCWMAWAVHREWGKAVNRVKRELSEVIQTIAQYEPVRLLAPPGPAFREARREFSSCSNVVVIEAPVDDIWMRDIAPTFGLRGPRGNTNNIDRATGAMTLMNRASVFLSAPRTRTPICATKPVAGGSGRSRPARSTSRRSSATATSYLQKQWFAIARARTGGPTTISSRSTLCQNRPRATRPTPGRKPSPPTSPSAIKSRSGRSAAKLSTLRPRTSAPPSSDGLPAASSNSAGSGKSKVGTASDGGRGAD